ncbi:MAG: hypothetical protein IJO55_04780 [Lachnospiraceae bacterium]|nr:hypothetical protein [Lachnospiraceae bacterium]
MEYFTADSMYRYIESWAQRHGMEQTLRVLPMARKWHAGQFRKGQEHIPYIYHPLTVACHALALGLNEDDLVTAALLHDVCEDCGVDPAELPVSEAAREAVKCLTKDSSYYLGPENHVPYYEAIAGNRIAIMVKLLDRCNNVSGMAVGFRRDRMIDYIRETERWFYPLFDRAVEHYPEMKEMIILLKYHMVSVVDTAKAML